MSTKYDISLGLTGRHKRKSSSFTATIIRKEIVISGAVGSRTENGKLKKPKTTYPCRFCQTITIWKTCQKCKDRIVVAPKVTRYHVSTYSLAELRAFGDELREKLRKENDV